MTEVEPRRPSSGEVRQPSPGPSDWQPAPDADSEGALSRLLDVLLDKGVYLDLDLVITVADVPLIAVNLRATIAGVETMLEWGVPGVWDEGRAPRTAPGATPGPTAEPRTVAAPADDTVELAAAMRETRAGSSVWRAGTLLVHANGTVQWRGDGDRRARLTFDLHDLEEVSLASDGDATPEGEVVALRVSGRSERIASRRAGEMVSLLAERRRATMRQGRVP